MLLFLLTDGKTLSELGGPGGKLQEERQNPQLPASSSLLSQEQTLTIVPRHLRYCEALDPPISVSGKIHRETDESCYCISTNDHRGLKKVLFVDANANLLKLSHGVLRNRLFAGMQYKFKSPWL